MGRKYGFSWKRASGLSAAKGRLSRQIGIPLTKEGRRRKFGPLWFLGLGGRRAEPVQVSESPQSNGCAGCFVVLIGVAVLGSIVSSCNQNSGPVNPAPQAVNPPAVEKNNRPANAAPVAIAGKPESSHSDANAGAGAARPNDRSDAEQDRSDAAMAEYEAAKAEYHAAEKLRLARQLKWLSESARTKGNDREATRLSDSADLWYSSITRFYPETEAADDPKALLNGEDVAERAMPPLPKLPAGVTAQTIDVVDKAVRTAAANKTGKASADSTGDYSGPAGFVTAGGSKTVHVRSYTRKDGTVVRAHSRSAPGSGGGRRR